MNNQTPSVALGITHRFLMWLFIFGVLGIGAELILLGHYEAFKQWIPLALIAISMVTLAWLLIQRSLLSLRFFQGTMVLYVISGILGLWFHFNGNREFELEMYPSMSGLDLLWESLTGATPALSPGTMVLLGLLGLTFAYTHIALGIVAASNSKQK